MQTKFIKSHSNAKERKKKTVHISKECPKYLHACEFMSLLVARTQVKFDTQAMCSSERKKMKIKIPCHRV